MKEIANQVFIDSSYQGNTVGFIRSGQNLLLIDVPFRAEDQQSWLRTINQLGNFKEKYLLLLDTHIDRTYVAHAVDANILAHRNAVEILEKRSNSIRPQDLSYGIDLDLKDIPTNIHWPVPNLTYSHDLFINWDEIRVSITHRPGAHLAGSWVHCDAEKVLFVGDSLVVGQPPFFAWSDLDEWLIEMDRLSSEAFRSYTIINSRNGIIRTRSIEKQHDLLLKAQAVIQEIKEPEVSPEDIKEAAMVLLRKINYSRELKELYLNRLIWGIKHYILRQNIELEADY